MQNSIFQKRILIASLLLVIVAVLILNYNYDPQVNNADKSGQHEENPDTIHRQLQVTQPTLKKNPETGEVIWKVGKPSPVIPVIRGKNNQRQFGTPKTRELPDVIENSAPSIMAMTPLDGRLHLLPDEIDQYTLKSRRMVLDTSALDRVIAGETNHIIAPTTGPEILDLKIESIRTRSKQTHTLIGKIAGEELSNVSIVYHDGIIFGAVSRYNKDQHFEYRIMADGYMMVRELDVPAIPQGCGNPGPATANAGHSCDSNCKHGEAELVDPSPLTPTPELAPSVEGDTAGWTTIDVVVGYGIQARIAEGGIAQIEARIIDSVDQMTTAFANSLVTNTEMMLLGTIEDPDYVFPGALTTDMGSSDELGDLDDTSGSNPELNTVSNFSALLGADLTSFICKDSQGGTAGIAYRPGKSSIVSRTSLFPSLTFAHELGHNLGCQHSLGDSTSDNVTNTARYGLRFKGTSGSRYRTIMAYDNTSTDSISGTYTASRIPYYANPNVSYDGTPTGINDGVNLTSNTFVDPAYATLGFNGSNPSLGARNAQMLMVASGSNGVVYASNRSTRAALSITSPLAAVQWPAGSTKTITFIGGDMDYTADIDLYKGGVYQYTIANDIDAIDHSFTWNIPLAQEGGNNFKIRVTLTHTGTLATSYAESGFFVIQGTSDIILESPLGGETWTRNTKKNITWSSSYGGNVKIEYIKGVAAPVTIVASTPDDGSYEWTIPYNFVLGTDYKIKITSSVSPFDTSQSASNFSIVAPSNNLLVTNLDTNPGFTTSGEFEYGIPQGPSGTPPDDLSGSASRPAYTGSYIYDTNLTDSSFGPSSLTTPAIDCSNHTNIVLEFYAHCSVYAGYTVSYQVSTDGSNWTTLFSEAGLDTATWTKYTYDITSHAAGEPTVYIRWSMTGSGTQWSGGGIGIDDISITGDFIPADGVTVISPDGGETLKHNLMTQIKWVSSMAGTVDIELLKNGSTHATIASNTPNDGVFYWFLPDTLAAAGDYKIRIKNSADATRTDDSNTNFSIAASSSTIYSTNLESNPGFTVTGEWEWGQPTSSDSAYPARSGTNTYDTKLNGFSVARSDLTTMAIDCSAYTNVQLEFYANIKHYATYFTAQFQVSNDGTNWTDVYNQTGINNGAGVWVKHSYNISAVANQQPTVYIRWRQLRASGGYTYFGSRDGIGIDDISLTGDFIPSVPTYDTWAKGPKSSDDSNNDGIKNAVAWVLGAANPAANATSLQPTTAIDNVDPNYVVFTYRRTDEANNDPNTTIRVEYGGNLVGWTTAVHDNDNIKITSDNDFYGTGIDRVQVRIKRSLATDNKLFSRLKVNVTE